MMSTALSVGGNLVLSLHPYIFVKAGSRSGSTLKGSWIRICIEKNSCMDPDSDPQKINADPQPCC